MILLSAVSNYHLLEIILYKITRLKDEKCVLLILDHLSFKYPNYLELRKLFSDIIIFQGGVAKNDKNQVCDNKPYFDQLLGNFNYSFNDFQEIYVAGAHLSLGATLSICNISYVFFEDAAGSLSNYTIVRNAEIGNNYELTISKEKLGLYDGSNKNVAKIICDIKKQSEEFIIDEKIEHFSVTEALELLSEKELNFVVKFFCSDKIQINSNSALVLTTHFANLKILTYEQQCLAYQLFCDYLLHNYNIVIKPHPDDLVPYASFMDNVCVVRKKFPSELLPYVFTINPTIIAGIATTATDNLKHLYSTISLGFLYRDYETLLSFHKYFILLKILHRLNQQFTIKIVNGLDELVNTAIDIENFNNITISNTDYNVLVLDDKGIEIKNKILDKHLYSNIVVFMNIDIFNIENIGINDILPVVCKKNKSKDEVYVELNDEIFFIYTTDLYIREVINTMSLDYNLKQTGINISKLTLTEKDIELLKLQGMLEATERKLLKEVEKNRILEQELQQFRGK